ncbi:hypothetical protein FHT40_006533 [Mycolicibacterium sp. BK556]|uniref:hypothetical protein n=1 Tax=unclassified Mycolicibacterium TaxID=2636767 RepID=UPI001792E9C7|nr:MULTISPECIES: hypothetical protein [unclassified Mycolicibacterium]MBB3606840.1 hypothetical protein [Mycolicibacterium sp. BK556]MBB3636494.1 hypothetical protein [Mycolicibacterium sp. BK607]
MGLFKKLSDPALLGGPSNKSVADDDPIWEPINGLSLENYAELARLAQTHGITDEPGMIALAQRERGWDPADTKAALDGWGAADGPVDGGRTAVPQAPRVLSVTGGA